MSDAPPGSRGLLVRHVALIVLLGSLVVIPGTGQLPLLDRDEPRFAQATVEMIDAGEWVIPTFNGAYRFDKPVLTYWLMRAGYALFGQGEFGARAHSMLTALLLGLVVYGIGRCRFSANTGFTAAVALLTCLQMFINGRSATADMPMILCVALSCWALLELLVPRPGPSRPWFWMLYLSLGFGFLAKGPIAWLVPGLAVLLMRFVLWRRPLPWRNLGFWRGLPMVLIIIGVWGIPALLQTEGLFWKEGMNKHVVQRGLEVFNGRFYVPIFYVVAAFVSLFPWITFSGRGWRALRERWSADHAFLAAWLLAPYLVFSFYATQLPHYVFPAFPAFFLLIGQGLDHPSQEGRLARVLRALYLLLVGVLAVAVVGVALPVVTPALPDGLRLVAAGLAAAVLGYAALGALAAAGRRRGVLVAVTVIGLGAGLLGYGARSVSPVVAMRPLLRAMPDETEYIGYGFTEGSMVFYSHRPWRMGGSPEAVATAMAAPGPRLAVVLLDEIKLDDAIKRHGTPAASAPADEGRGAVLGDVTLADLEAQGYTVQRVEGVNFGRTSWVRLAVVYRET